MLRLQRLDLAAVNAILVLQRLNRAAHCVQDRQLTHLASAFQAMGVSSRRARGHLPPGRDHRELAGEAVRARLHLQLLVVVRGRRLEARPAEPVEAVQPLLKRPHKVHQVADLLVQARGPQGALLAQASRQLARPHRQLHLSGPWRRGRPRRREAAGCGLAVGKHGPARGRQRAGDADHPNRAGRMLPWAHAGHQRLHHRGGLACPSPLAWGQGHGSTAVKS
mmetsp:Transcript_51336/g.138318  ORF Transcript_51336/g.138318 Transcript_51336/m.138318 type:complete len:222 (+) Transcript_51336:1490-2155(+)